MLQLLYTEFMSKQALTCPKCKGKGEIVHIDPLLAVVTFGLTALIEAGDPDRCNTCKGKGYVVVDLDD